jgi:hypothetical protein
MKHFISILLTASFMTGCATHQPPEVSGELDSWFEIQKKISEKLNNQQGIGGIRNHVSPILGAQYSIGTILSKDGDFLTRCIIDESQIVKFGMRLPAIHAKTDFDTKIGLPESWISQYKIGQAQAIYKAGGETKYQLTDIVVDTVSSLDVDEIIKKNKCFETLREPQHAGKETKFVRGIIFGKLVASSIKSLEVGANLSVSETELLKITYDPNGGFSVEEKTITPQYFIITNVIMPGVDGAEIPKSAERITYIDEHECRSVAGFAYGVKEEKPTDVSLQASEKENNNEKCNQSNLTILGQ